MANLQQCLLHYSVQPPKPRRRRRKRNKGRRAITPLNNSIIQVLPRSTTSSSGNYNLCKLDTPGRSTVKATIGDSPPRPIIENSEVKPTFEKLKINEAFQKLTASQSFKQSLVNQTIDLCSDDSSNETFDCTYSGDNKHCLVSKKNESMIDISEDIPDENEVIVLPNDDRKPPKSKCPYITPSQNNSPENKCPFIAPSKNKSFDTCSSKAKPANNRPPKHALLHRRSEIKSPVSKSPERKRHCTMPPDIKQPDLKPANSSLHGKKSEAVVIDISDDGGEDDLDLSKKNDTNDEVLVIGTFNKTSKLNAVPPKKVPPKIQKKLIKDKVKKIQKECLKELPTERPKENPTPGSSTSGKQQRHLDPPQSSDGNSNSKLVKLRRRIKAKYFTKLLQNKKKMEVDLLDTIKYQHLFLNNTLSGTELSSGVGRNVYINAPVYIPTSGLRPIMIDGSNVAFTSDNPYKFSCKRLDICIKYFKEKGHKVTAFVPQFRVQSNQSDNPGLLDQLVRSGDVVLTPSKVIDGKLIVPYDDRFIVQAAVLKGGVIISRDNYKDLLEENPTWAETIKYRTLAYTWVDDVLMFPSDPLGVVGPSLEEFLSFN